jgi:hypothetical protein
VLQVIPAPQVSKLVLGIRNALVGVGIVTLVYLLLLSATALSHLHNRPVSGAAH